MRFREGTYIHFVLSFDWLASSEIIFLLFAILSTFFCRDFMKSYHLYVYTVTRKVVTLCRFDSRNRSNTINRKTWVDVSVNNYVVKCFIIPVLHCRRNYYLKPTCRGWNNHCLPWSSEIQHSCCGGLSCKCNLWGQNCRCTTKLWGRWLNRHRHVTNRMIFPTITLCVIKIFISS